MLPFNDLVARVIRQESGGNPNAVNSSSGASGLMQIMPATAADPGFGVQPMDWSQRFNAKENRRFGTDYLTAMLNQFDGDQSRALVAYNWGVGNAGKWDGDMASLPAETRNYVSNILGGGPAPDYQTGSAHTQQPDSLTTAMTQPAAPPETVKIFGWDTGASEADLSKVAALTKAPAVTPMQLPQIPKGGGITATDGLARALAAHQKLKQRRG